MKGSSQNNLYFCHHSYGQINIDFRTSVTRVGAATLALRLFQIYNNLSNNTGTKVQVILTKALKMIKNIICFLIPILFWSDYCLSSDVDKKYIKIKDTDIVLGSEDAPVTVIEYSSLSCPYCAYFHSNIFSKLKEEYVDKSLVRWVRRDFVINPSSLSGAMLLHCFSKEEYFLMSHILFAKQSSWAFSSHYLEKLEIISGLSGMQPDIFWKCMKNKELEEQILSEKLYATNVLGINGTPSFFINGKEVKGNFGYDNIKQEIADAIISGSK